MKTQEIAFDLKMTPTPLKEIDRGDIVFKKGALWQCVSKSLNRYTNMETKQQQQFEVDPSKQSQCILKLAKMQLIPVSWSVSPNNMITLEGRQLGMGPLHKITVSEMKSFEEMQMIISSRNKGKELRHKVVLCETSKSSHYLIVAIQLL